MKIKVKITAILMFGLVCTYGQVDCKMLTSTAQTTFASALQGSSSNLNGDIIGSQWTEIGSPDILIMPWAESDETSTDAVLASVINGDVGEAPNATDAKMLGAVIGEGIKFSFSFDVGFYLLRFSQVNARRYNPVKRPSSANWKIKLDGTDVGESTYKFVETETYIDPWTQSLIVIDIPTKGLYEISIIAASDNEYDLPLTGTNNGLPTSNYMLIDNIKLYKQGECEFPPVLNDKDHSSFAPIPEKSYVVSAWIKEAHATQTTSYTSPINISFEGNTTTYSFVPTGAIIEGWQRIEGVFTIPIGSTDMHIALTNNAPSGSTFYDDIRIHNAEGNMKSFVYDPITQRLMAELDENNYATLYEYDTEGGLVRVKKETEKGVFTIQETRSGNSKINTQN